MPRSRVRARGGALVVGLSFALAGALAAQSDGGAASTGGSPIVSAPDAIARADSLLGAERVEDALAALDARLSDDPADFEARWRAARAAVYLGILASGTEIENGWFRRGAEHAQQALAQRPDHPEALRWALAAKGNLAVQTGPAESARLGREVWELAHRVLEHDPRSADAHYALGKLEYELLKLNRVQRLLSRPFRRGELAHPSWSQALAYHERAVALDPDSQLFRLGLADTLWHVERHADATRQLEIARALPLRSAVDRDFRARAELLLRKIGQGRDPTK